MVLLIGLKIVATAVCYSSGNAGGIFGPSLFIGAMIGGAVGSVAHHFFPAVTAGPGAYALVGMGATFAGIIRTPLTSVIMIFELTRDYTIIVPVMIANLLAFIISYRLQRQPIYEALAHQDGIFLPTEERGESGPTVGLIMRPLSETTVDEAHALANMQEAGVRAWPLIDNGCMAMMIGTAKVLARPSSIPMQQRRRRRPMSARRSGSANYTGRSPACCAMRRPACSSR